MTGAGAHDLLARLVSVALEWEREYGVAPAITSAISDYFRGGTEQSARLPRGTSKVAEPCRMES